MGSEKNWDKYSKDIKKMLDTYLTENKITLDKKELFSSIKELHTKIDYLIKSDIIFKEKIMKLEKTLERLKNGL